jgi:hypothetical protein
MARRAPRGGEEVGQLSLWAEEIVPSPSQGEGRTANPPSPAQGEGRDGSSAVTPNERPNPASPPKSKPLRAIAAARKDSIARSERALAAIRSILASESREEAARHAAAFRRNR